MNQLEQLREQCAAICDEAKKNISPDYIIGEDVRNAGIACCENIAKRIRALPLPEDQTEALREENEDLNALLLATNNDLMSALNHVHELNEAISNFNALIEFAQITDEPEKVLNLWQHGCFKELRKFWPEAPEAIYPKEMAK